MRPLWNQLGLSVRQALLNVRQSNNGNWDLFFVSFNLNLLIGPLGYSSNVGAVSEQPSYLKI